MGRVFGFLLPGIPQLLRGRWLEGGMALSVWVSLLTLVAVRSQRVAYAVMGGLEDRVALITLLLALVGVWGWSRWEARPERVGGSGSESPVGGSGFFWWRFRRNRMAVFGLWVVVGFYLAALLTPFLAPYDPAFQPAFQGGGMELRLAPPSGGHLMGTDQFSRDILSRILYGARISLSIGFLAVGISVSIGALLGAVAGYLGGWVDTLVGRFVDMMMAFPRVVLLIALVAVFQPSIFLLIAALSLTQWPLTTRVVRGEVLSLRNREFAEAARALGFSKTRIIFRHILPNALAPVIVTATLGIGYTIVLEAGLSFLGLGVQQPTPSWGSMVADGRDYLMDAWWIATFPGLAIVLVVLAFNLVGDGLRDALDPRGAFGRSTR